jgi:hypothetical protein
MGIMASFDEHCEDCIRELGQPYPEVHIWLDDFYKTLGPKHRDVRHHTGGVDEIRKKWGPQAAQAAEIHIKKDCCGIIPSKEKAQLWNLFGPNTSFSCGRTFLTDEEYLREDKEDKEDKDDGH